ncbi:MAG TPA: lysylphosphatidylglycerol synthase domain-containing protein [Candidatus Binatia bacterium]|nr:lysylphosphatidylglycerol synthase domain-containing protein [Candidatus Binatia bacterium]
MNDTTRILPRPGNPYTWQRPSGALLSDERERLGRPNRAAMIRPAWSRRIERTLLVGGVVLFGVLLHEIGAAAVLDNVRAVGWAIVLIVAQEVLAYTANTLGWWYAFPSPRPSLAFSQLLATRIAGDAVNYVTPTATLGGEFVRVRMLRGQGVTTSVVASVAIAKLSQTVGQVIFIVLGLLIVLPSVSLPPPLRRGLFLGVSALVAVAMVLLVMQRRGLFAPVLAMLHKMGLPHAVSGLSGRLERLDDEIMRFYARAGSRFFLSAFWFFIGWTLGILEVSLILFCLGVPLTIERAVAIEVLSATIDAMLFFVPAKVGTQEGGKVLIFDVLGLDMAKGLSLGIVRRIRELTWAGIGLLIWSRAQAEPRPVAGPATIGN